MSNPRISVLMPVRNALPYLHDALSSVLAQTFADFECLVLDDGSNDGSGDVVRACRDRRVRLIDSGARGLAHALNAGLAEARGEYVARHDADDFSDRARFALQVSFLDTYRRVDVLSSRVAFVNEAGAPLETAWTRTVRAQWDAALAPDAIARLMPLTCCIVHGSVMARRDVLLSAGGYSEHLRVAQDYDLWLRLLHHHRFARLPELLYTFRVHDRQVSAAAGDEQRRQAVAAKLRYVRQAAGLTGFVRAWLADTTPATGLYRDLMRVNGLVEVGEHDAWDVAIFTGFEHLDDRMGRVNAREWPARTMRIGNFLVRRRMAA